MELIKLKVKLNANIRLKIKEDITENIKEFKNMDNFFLDIEGYMNYEDIIDLIKNIGIEYCPNKIKEVAALKARLHFSNDRVRIFSFYNDVFLVHVGTMDTGESKFADVISLMSGKHEFKSTEGEPDIEFLILDTIEKMYMEDIK